MNKSLAKTLTTALVQFIDKSRPEDTMCCSNAECESIEEMFKGECFDIIETFIQRKLSGLTEFEQEVSDIVEYCKEHGEHVAFDYAKRHAKTLLAIAREQFIKDGYVIEKKAFHDAVEKVDPEVMKEVSDNVDKANEELTEFEQGLLDYAKERDEYKYDPTNVAELNEKVIELTKFYAQVLLTRAKKELARQGEVITLDKLAPYDKGFQDGKAEALKDLPRWNKHDRLFSEPEYRLDFKITSLGEPYLEIKKGDDYYYIRCSELKKLPGFKEGEK